MGKSVQRVWDQKDLLAQDLLCNFTVLL